MPRVDLLIDLLRKIARSTQKVHVEIDYNGREFFWKIPQHNLTAEEWRPGGVREHDSARNSDDIG